MLNFVHPGVPQGRRRCDRLTGCGRSGHGRCVSVQTVASRCVTSTCPEQTSRGTTGSKRFHPLRRPPYRTAWGMLVAMQARSARPLPIPKCSSAVAATLPTPPAALSPVYMDVVRRELMAITTSIGNFIGGNLAAAVSARERNDSRAINRDQAPATICNGLHRYAPDCNVNWPPFLIGQQ
jgi:hypothetical protein